MWESKELQDINRAFMRMLARSAGQQAVQLALYATVSSAPPAAAPSQAPHPPFFHLPPLPLPNMTIQWPTASCPPFLRLHRV